METTSERLQVLQMLRDGKITPEQADQLLERLAARSQKRAEDTEEGPGPRGTTEERKKYKYLRIDVESESGDTVHIRVPLGLIRAGLKFSHMMPKDIGTRLSKEGIDLSKLAEMNPEELVEHLGDLGIDIKSSEGETVKIFCE